MFSFDSLQEAVVEPVAETEVLDAMEELQVLLQSSEPADPGGAGQQRLFLARLAAVQLAVRRCEGLACNVELERGLLASKGKDDSPRASHFRTARCRRLALLWGP